MDRFNIVNARGNGIERIAAVRARGVGKDAEGLHVPARIVNRGYQQYPRINVRRAR